MARPTLSVMIPTYNCAKYLRDAITSVLEQDYEDFELIITDNASTDDTQDVIREFTDARIQSHRNPRNLGISGNLNRCMELASGKYLRHLCADDALLPGILRKQVEALETHANVGLVTCDMFITDDNLNGRDRANFYPGTEHGKKVIRACCLSFNNRIGGPSNVMFRRIATQGQWFSPRLQWLADIDFYSRILETADYLNIDEPGYLYRRHESAATAILSRRREVQQQEEFEFCVSRAGCHLCHSSFLRSRISLWKKAWLIKEMLGRKSRRAALRFCRDKVLGQDTRSVVLGDYFGVYVAKTVSYANSNGIVSIGSGTSINDYTVVRIENGPEAYHEASSLLIGENTYIGEMNNLRAAGGVIRIGNNVILSQFVTVVASNHGIDRSQLIRNQRWTRSTVTIEDDVWIGAGCVILPGSHIGVGAVIAANSVVKGRVEPYSVVGGSPARRLKERP
jgi:acetyltransferase-like isoleucine patch superfamily enzyme